MWGSIALILGPGGRLILAPGGNGWILGVGPMALILGRSLGHPSWALRLNPEIRFLLFEISLGLIAPRCSAAHVGKGFSKCREWEMKGEMRRLAVLKEGRMKSRMETQLRGKDQNLYTLTKIPRRGYRTQRI